MRNNMDKLSKPFKIIVISLICLLNSLVFYYGVVSLWGILVDEFESVLMVLPVVLAPFLVMSVFFYDVRYRNGLPSKTLSLNFLGVISALFIFSVVLIFTHTHYYFSSASTLSRAVLTVLIHIYALLLILKDYYLVITKEGQKRHFQMNLLRYILLCFLTCISFYFIGDFIRGVIRFRQYTMQPFFYPVLLLTILVPAADLIYLVLREEKKNKAYSLTMISINLVFGVMDIIMMCGGLILPEVGQNIFYCDYMASVSFGPVVLLIIFIVTLVYCVLDLIKKSSKA